MGVEVAVVFLLSVIGFVACAIGWARSSNELDKCQNHRESLERQLSRDREWKLFIERTYQEKREELANCETRCEGLQARLNRRLPRQIHSKPIVRRVAGRYRSRD